MQAYRSTPPPTNAAGTDGAAQADSRLRLAYLVSRFPKTTETFVVRELNRVAAHPEIHARLYALFAPQSTTSTVHPSAEAWMEQVRRPTLAQAIAASARWTARRPLTMLRTIVLLLIGFGRTPRKLAASLGALLVACAQAERMQEEGIDHVHAHFVGHTATAAWVIRRLTGIEYSVTAHAYELFQDREFLRRRVRDASFVITISRFNADFLFRYCRGITPPITVVRAGVDLDRFTFRDRTIPAEGPIRVLAVGSLIGHKGHRILLTAIAGDDPTLGRVELTIVGDGEERPRLEALIDQLGLSSRVRLTGSLPEPEVARLLTDSDLYVLPSLIASSGRMEGIPVVLMEALASGVPVVATRLSGIPELVEDGVTGRLAEQGNPVSLARAIREVVADPEGARTRARAGRERVEAEFDVDNSAAVLAERFLAIRPAAQARGRAHRPAFVAWSRSGRSREMAAATGAYCHVVYIMQLRTRALAPLRYVLSAASTVTFLLRSRPSVVVATNPPIFPALIVHLLRRVTGTSLILDSHPRGFGLKRSAAGRLMTPLHRYLVRHARATLVAGPELAEVVGQWGARTMIVHEAPPTWSINSPPRLEGAPTVLWPTIFATDEPVIAVLDAARRLPNVKFLVTGDVKRCPPELRAGAPENVTFTGFWVDEGYSRLLAASDVMLVLTTEAASVPRAAFEAVEALRPLVLSNLASLQPLFPDAIFVGNDAGAIATGIQDAIDRHAELSDAAAHARDDQRARWRGQLQALNALLEER